LTLYDEAFASRFLLGTALYSSPAVMQEAIRAAGCDMVTLGLRRQNPAGGDGDAFWQLLRDSGCRLLPNTAGCRSAREAITLAQMSRELFDTP
jgi:thiazole synthase